MQVEEALGIFQDMVARGCERNVITYSSLVGAAEKAGRWQLGLELLDEMHRDGCAPNAVTFNALISACAQGALPRLRSEFWS
jgi:pentatricopeptide repeat domain-containing protein 1